MDIGLTTINNTIDDEWLSFISLKYDNTISDDENNNTSYENKDQELISTETFITQTAPEPSDIYISTKSKIAYLEQPIDLKIFWDIPIIPYASPINGVIKKQIKLNSKTPEDLEIVQTRLKNELYYEQHIMSHIDNPNGRIVMIIRIKLDNVFREFHIKVFNTGKLEIPGVQSEEMFETVLHNIISILQPFHDYVLSYKQKSDTVLINSNFNCGFFINRETLYDILRNKYNIQAIYDSCSYPGIQCKFYYNNDIGVQTGMQISKENKEISTNITEVSFMIFRTGSVLIVGMCDENVIHDIYQFLKALLKTEFKSICQKIINNDTLNTKDKKKKIRKKIIYIDNGVINDDNNDVNNDVNKVNNSCSIDSQYSQYYAKIHSTKLYNSLLFIKLFNSES